MFSHVSVLKCVCPQGGYSVSTREGTQLGGVLSRGVLSQGGTQPVGVLSRGGGYSAGVGVLSQGDTQPGGILSQGGYSAGGYSARGYSAGGVLSWVGYSAGGYPVRQSVLATPWSVCLLRLRRRTFLLYLS